MLSLEDLNRIITSEATPEEKLRVFLEHIIRTAMNASELWGDQDIPARTGLALALRAQIHHNGGIPEIPETPGTDTGHHGPSTGFSGDAAATALVALPCMGSSSFRKSCVPLMLPATAGDAEGLLEDMLAYMLGGLRALGEAAR